MSSTTPTASVSPSILRWARETAGLSVEEAAEKLQLATSQKSSAADKLQALEAGEVVPTRRQLLKFSEVYRRPLTVFYRQTPPPQGERGEDFRLVPPPSQRDDALLDALLREVKVRHTLAKGILEDDEAAQELTFVGSLDVTTPVPKAVAYLSSLLGTPSLEQQPRQNTDRFSDLRSRIEGLGVFVLLIGDLGSHHSAIAPETFRGFAIADKVAPFIIINDQDARTAWIFTLVHEFVHILVGSSGVSGALPSVRPLTPKQRIEAFCNDVAGEFLVPAAVVRQVRARNNEIAVTSFLSTLASSLQVSEPMAAHRVFQLRMIDDNEYSNLIATYSSRWRASREAEKVKKSSDEGGGPNYYVVRRHRLGSSLLRLVSEGLSRGAITYTKAARILGVKPGIVGPLLRYGTRDNVV